MLFVKVPEAIGYKLIKSALTIFTVTVPETVPPMKTPFTDIPDGALIRM
jgi:hypothetical protein